MKILLHLDLQTRGGLQRQFTDLARMLGDCGHEPTFLRADKGPILHEALVTNNTPIRHSGEPSVLIDAELGPSPAHLPTSSKIQFLWGDMNAGMLACQDFDLVITCSDRTYSAVMRSIPELRDRLVYLDNPLPNSNLPNNDRAQWRQRHGIPRDAFLILALARFVAVKRLGRLLLECAPFLRSHRNVRLVIAGPQEASFTGASSTFKRCRRLSIRLGLERKVILIDHLNEPEAALGAADVYVSLSESEGQSLATSEALWAGLPVVVTATSGSLRQVISAGCRQNGYLVPVFGRSDLPAILEDLRYSPALRERLGRNGHRLAKIRFNNIKYMTNLSSLLERVSCTEGKPYKAPALIPQRPRRVLITTYGGIARVSPRLRAYWMQEALRPFNYLVDVAHVDQIKPRHLQGYDILIHHRSPHRLLLEQDEEKRTELRQRLQFIWDWSLRIRPTIYDLDDYLFVDDSSPSEIEDLNQTFLATATLVVANNISAARRFLSWNKNVAVVENPIDDRLWNPALWPRLTSTPTFGWIAGNTHDSDAEWAFSIGDAVLRHCPGSRFVVVGGPTSRLNHPTNRITQLPTLPWYDIPRIMAQFHVSIAPLVPSLENDCKGHGHIAEPSALGVPSVVQDTPSYRDVITSGDNGFLAGDVDDWMVKVTYLLNNPRFRRSISHRARKQTLQRFGFLTVGRSYAEKFTSILAL